VSAALKLYVKGWCPWCITAKRYLDARGYQYEEVDVQHDRDAYREMIELSGQAYTPTLKADGRVLADFGPDELEAFLKKHRIEP
jgi:glutaredoxin 3